MTTADCYWQLQLTVNHEQKRKKGPFVDEKLYKKVAKLNENRAKQPIKTWAGPARSSRSSSGHTFEVHNGNKFLKVFVQEDMVGHKLGEFSPDAHVPRPQRHEGRRRPAHRR